MFLYPLAMALIFLSILSPLFHKSSVVYVWVVVFTVVPAVFDMVAAFPAVVSQSTFGQAMAHVQKLLTTCQQWNGLVSPCASWCRLWYGPLLVVTAGKDQHWHGSTDETLTRTVLVKQFNECQISTAHYFVSSACLILLKSNTNNYRNESALS